MSPVVAVDDAYTACEAVVREQARNFAYGIRLLPRPKRQALSAVYAFARRVDDIGDGPLPGTTKLDQLASARASLDDLGADPSDAVLVALADATRRYPIPVEAFGELIDGVEMDARGTRYETFDDLVVYCRRVAGSIGRLSLGIFGHHGPSPEVASHQADVLGVALQVTNILRDVLEDRQMGRVYLPADDLRRFGCDPDLAELGPAFPDVVRLEVARARACFAEGLELLGGLDRRSRACVSAMSGIYRRLLGRIDREPLALTRGRLSLPTWEKAWVATRSLAGLQP